MRTLFLLMNWNIPDFIFYSILSSNWVLMMKISRPSETAQFWYTLTVAALHCFDLILSKIFHYQSEILFSEIFSILCISLYQYSIESLTHLLPPYKKKITSWTLLNKHQILDDNDYYRGVCPIYLYKSYENISFFGVNCTKI